MVLKEKKNAGATEANAAVAQCVAKEQALRVDDFRHPCRGVGVVLQHWDGGPGEGTVDPWLVADGPLDCRFHVGLLSEQDDSVSSLGSIRTFGCVNSAVMR